MKLTVETLKRIIKEELAKINLKEGFEWLLMANEGAVMDYLEKGGGTMVLNAILKDMEDSSGKIAFYMNSPDQAAGHKAEAIKQAATKLLSDVKAVQKDPAKMLGLLRYMAKNKEPSLVRRDVNVFVLDRVGEEIVSPMLQKAGLNK